MRASTRLLFRIAVLTSLLVGLVGCAAPTSTPDVTPPVAAPAEFTASGTAVMQDRWWEVFDDPGLDALMTRMLADNLSLRVYWDRIAQAEASLRASGGSLYPSVIGTAGAGRSVNRVDPESNSNQPGGTTWSTSLNMGLSVSYELDLWGRLQATRDALAFAALASQENLQAAALSLTAQVATAWYRIAEQQAKLALLDSQEALAREVLQAIRIRQRRGQAYEDEALRQEQTIIGYEQQRAEANLTLETLQHELAILVGEAPGVDILTGTPTLIDLPALPTTGLPAELVRRRPDIRSAALGVAAADARLEAAIANQFPKLSISASSSTSVSNANDLFSNWLVNLAGNLTAPIFQGGQLRAEVERNRAAVSEAVHSYGSTVLNAFGEVEDALSSETHQRDILATVWQQRDMARTVTEQIRQRWRNGSATFTELRNAQTSQQSLEMQVLSAQRALIVYRIQLYRALAGGIALDRPDLAVAVIHESSSRDTQPE